MGEFRLDSAFQFATDLAVRVGHAVQPLEGSDEQGRTRAPDIDTDTQEQILQAILAEYPDTPFALCAEEASPSVQRFGGSVAEGHARWVIDPIDGTRNFFRPDDPKGRPRRYSVSIAMQRADGSLAFGVLYFPASDELFRVGPDTPAERNGQPLDRQALADVEPREPVSSMRIVGGPNRVRKQLDQPIHHGCATWSLMCVATGTADAWIFRRTHLWDIAAGAAILEAAGGLIGLPDGTPLRPQADAVRLDGFFVAAPNRRVLGSVYSWLQQLQIPLTT